MRLNVILLVSLFGSVVLTSFGQDAAPAQKTASAPAPSATMEAFRPLFEKIGAKIRTGQRTPEALAPELAEYEALLKKFADQKTEEVAQFHAMRAMLFAQVFSDLERARTLLVETKEKFAGTRTASEIDRTLAEWDRQAEIEKAKAALVGKPAPELNFLWSSREGVTKLSDLKGKVVVIDFWATWCGPCVQSFPNVRELTAHYEGQDVAVLGVTSVQGRVHGLESKPIDTRNDPDREFALMREYMKAKDITWTVAFSKEEVFNPDYGVTGIPHMVIIAPDGTVRHADMDPRDPHSEKVAKIDAILQEFGKKTAAK